MQGDAPAVTNAFKWHTQHRDFFRIFFSWDGGRLDYEKYIDDLEVRQAVVAVQTRINEIRFEHNVDAYY